MAGLSRAAGLLCVGRPERSLSHTHTAYTPLLFPFSTSSSFLLPATSQTHSPLLFLSIYLMLCPCFLPLFLSPYLSLSLSLSSLPPVIVNFFSFSHFLFLSLCSLFVSGVIGRRIEGCKSVQCSFPCRCKTQWILGMVIFACQLLSLLLYISFFLIPCTASEQHQCLLSVSC